MTEIHHGKLINARLIKEGLNLRTIASEIGIHYATLWRWLSKSKLSKKEMVKISPFINFDKDEMLLEIFKSGNISIAIEKSNHWQEKYYSLLEKQNGLQEQIIKLQQDLISYKNV